MTGFIQTTLADSFRIYIRIHQFILKRVYNTPQAIDMFLFHSSVKITAHGCTMPLSPVVMSISSSPLALAALS